jgi:hypothetical protein
MKLLGQRLMARAPERQVAKLQVRVAIMDGLTALGIPITKAAGQVSPGKSETWPSVSLRNTVALQNCVEKVVVSLGHDVLLNWRRSGMLVRG